MPRMSASAPTGEEQAQQRPTLVLLVYSWDMLLGILAIFGALAAFGGQVAVGARLIEVPLLLQILGAMSSAAYAAILLILAALLTRRQTWIRRVQIVTLAAAVALALSSLLVGYLSGGGVDILALLVTLLFVLVDTLCIVVMTEKRINAWYTEPAAAPRYAVGTLGFWVLSGLALLIIQAAVR
jgi:hypothetical protein